MCGLFLYVKKGALRTENERFEDCCVHLQLLLVWKGNNIKIFAFLDGLISHFHCL
jgi:hypothetical protein